MGRIARSVAMAFVRGFFVRAAVTVYVLAVFIAFFLIPLGRMSRTVGADGTEILLPFGVGAFFLLVLPALVAWIGVRWRNARFDSMFGALGLAGFPYALQYRRYDGTFGGRRLQALFSRGPRIVLEAETAVATRFGVTAGEGDTALLAALAGERPIPFAVPAFDGLVVYGREEPWVRRLLSEPGVPALLARLLRYQGPLARRQLVLRPGALMLTCHLSTAFLSWIPSPGQARDWAEALVALAQLAERVPPPAVPLAPTRLEERIDTIRGVDVKAIPGAVALVAILATALLVGSAAGAILLFGESFRPARGPGSLSEVSEVLGHVHSAARSLQVADLAPVGILGLHGAPGQLGTLEREDAAGLHAVAKTPPGAHLVIAKDPVSGAAREVAWTFATPLRIPMRLLEETWGEPAISPAPGDPTSVVAEFATKPAEGARPAVRVRVTFAGRAGGPVTRIAAYRGEPAATPSVPGTATPPLLSPCPASFALAGDMAVGESRSCICVHDPIGGAVFGNGRYGPASSVCQAAWHAGAVRKPGDTATYWRQPDCPRLWGAEGERGIVSTNAGAAAASFSFTADPPPCPPPPGAAEGLAPCPTGVGRALEDLPEGASFECTCSYERHTRGVAWGKDVYAIFSNVCNAAQHAGAVDPKGSTVTVFLGGPCDRYVRSSRGGIDSGSWNKPARSMAFRLPYPPCPGAAGPR